MSKILLFLILSSYSTTTLPNCDIIYENPNLYSEWLKVDITKQSLEKIKNYTNNVPLDEKLSLYDQMWELLTTRIKKANESIKSKAEALVASEGQEAADHFANLARTAAGEEYIPLNDLIIEDIANELNQKGIRNILGTKIIDGTSPAVSYKFITILPDRNSTSISSKKLARYQSMFDIESYTVDLFENSLGSSRGFYIASKKRVDLGTNGIKSILIDDMPTFVVKHEGKHAGFARNRHLDGSPSIYDSSYLVHDPTINLTSQSGGYSKYMSAEELYNWANDPYWISERFRNIKNYTVAAIVEDLNNSIGQVYGTINIASQTEELAGFFSNRMKLFKGDIDGGMRSMIPLTINYEVASTIDEIRFLQFFDYESKRSIRIHIPKQIRADAQKVAYTNFLINYNAPLVLKQNGFDSVNDVSVTELKKIRRLIRIELAKDGQDAAPEYRRVLSYIINQQNKLKTNAISIKAKSEDLTVYFESFVEEFNFAKERSGRDFLYSEEWHNKFLNLRRKFRDLGRAANELWNGNPAYVEPRR